MSRIIVTTQPVLFATETQRHREEENTRERDVYGFFTMFDVVSISVLWVFFLCLCVSVALWLSSYK